MRCVRVLRSRAEIWPIGLRLSVVTLALVSMLCGCADQIPVATPDSGERPSELADRGETLTEPAAHADLLQAAVAVSVSARSLVAALGRPGAPIADKTFPPEAAAIQRRALPTLLDSFQTKSDRFLSLIQQPHPLEENEWRAHRMGYSAAVDHMIETTENVIGRGGLDRVHPLYVDRLDEHVVALVLKHDQQRAYAGLPFALDVLRMLLHELEAAATRSCVELQCAGYGVFAPLSVAARSSLLIPTTLVMSIEPTASSWFRWIELADDDREFLLAAVKVAFTAARHLVDHNLVLVSGADEFARRGFLVFHQPQWPFNALALTDRLLAQYEASLTFSD